MSKPTSLFILSAPMAESVQQSNGGFGLVRDCHKVKSAVITSTVVECLSDSGVLWNVAVILASDNQVQNEQQFAGPNTPNSIIYACRGDNLRSVTSSSLPHVEMSIPDGVRELCDGCFKGLSGLRRVTFGPSSSLERIGVEAFGAVREQGKYKPCGLVEISIPAGVRELCDGCFKGCSSLRRVTFSPSSSLERIGVSCFKRTGVESVAVPDSVRELCDGCFKGCSSLRRVTFGPSSSLEWIDVSCIEDS